MTRRDTRDWVERFVTHCDWRDHEPFPRNPFQYLALVGVALFALLIEFVQIATEENP